MKSVIAATAIAAMLSTAANASPVCDDTDIVIGIGIGITAATVIGVSAVAGATLVGPGVAAGSVVGWSGAVSAPFLTGSTIPAVIAANILVAPTLSILGMYAACASDALLD